MSDTPFDCNLIILNYNGRDLLEKFLPSVLVSAKASRYPCKVSVLDNCSSDDSVSFLNQFYPEVDIFTASANKVLCSYNEMLKVIPEDYVILLNNDIQTDPDFVSPLLSALKDHPDALFAATHGDRSRPKFKWGILSADISYPGHEALADEPGAALSAGIAAFHRTRFLELGGYDEIYLPGIYEDVDLCYRGWKRGWKGYYVPASRKFHVGSASFKRKYSAGEVQRFVFRNSLFFMLKNVADPLILTRFYFLLPLRLAAALLTFKWFILAGFWDACLKLPQVFRSKRSASPLFRLSDREVLRSLASASGRKAEEPRQNPTLAVTK